jgi:phosphoglycolate phosphatase
VAQKSLKNYKLLIFDWDGTLMESTDVIVKSILSTVNDLKLQKPSIKAIHDTIGLNLKDQCDILFPNVNYEQFHDRHLENYATYSSEATFFDGAIETLNFLKKLNYKLAIATSKHRHRLEKQLNDYNLNSLFSATSCGDDGFSKPDPRMIKTILNKLKIDAKRSVMIGDSEYDMQLANGAGVNAIAVCYGIRDKEQLSKYKPIKYINDIRELQPLFNPFL